MLLFRDYKKIKLVFKKNKMVKEKGNGGTKV
jgi:hypothetical protein